MGGQYLIDVQQTIRQVFFFLNQHWFVQFWVLQGSEVLGFDLGKGQTTVLMFKNFPYRSAGFKVYTDITFQNHHF